MIYYGKMVMVRSKRNVFKVALLVYKIIYIKSLLESFSSIVLDSKDEMNPVYSDDSSVFILVWSRAITT